MKAKGQGALEYLLLIGGAVLVAAIVLSVLMGQVNVGGQQPDVLTAKCLSLDNQDYCSKFSEFDTVAGPDCEWCTTISPAKCVPAGTCPVP